MSILGRISPRCLLTSAGLKLSRLSAGGENRRIRMSLPTITMGILTLAMRFSRSSFAVLSSMLRFWSSSLRVVSSSLLECSSSLAVSSSSLVL